MTSRLLTRANKRLMMILFDSVLLVAILLASFSIRLGHWYFPEADLIWVIFGSPIIAIPIFIYFDLYLSIVRYIGFSALWKAIQAISVYALLWGVIGFMFSVNGIPRSVILINWALALLVIIGLRIIVRFLLSGSVNSARFRANDNCKKILIYGAGDAGIQLTLALSHSKEYFIVGFIDDSKDLQGSQIKGISVYSVDNIEKVIDKFKVSEVLIAMPSVSRAKRLSIINSLECYEVVVKTLPDISSLVSGKVELKDLRKVDIEDLLGREKVSADKDLLSANIENKIVMVTGAGGSIGSELCRMIFTLGVKKLILFEHSEFLLYSIHKELSENTNHPTIIPILGSVVDKNRLKEVCQYFNVQTIYHAAAYKHVPMVESNNIEGVKNNIFGTLSTAQAAIECDVEAFVLISTDKAVRPTNTMGATKRVAELILQALSNKNSKIKFTMVRFGNVLGSSGSVIPLFNQQIKEGGPVTITDKDIIRYFMTIHEAVELVIQAGAMGEGGDVFVLDMGDPVRIKDLAKKMIRLSGLEVKDDTHPDGDIEIVYTGLRHGEKLYEELLIGGNVNRTSNPLIMRAEEESLTWDELRLILDEMSQAIKDSDLKKIRALLVKAVPSFLPQCEIVDFLYRK